jgi:hypothetical protein
MKLAISRAAKTSLAMTAALGLAAAACGGGGNNTGGGTTTGTGGNGTGGTTGTGGNAGGSNVSNGVYHPTGCGFSVAGRPEYEGFAAGSDKLGAAVMIQRVRLGLGGDVSTGAAHRADPSTSIGVGWQTDEGTLATTMAWGNDPDPSKWPAANVAKGATWDTPPGLLGNQPAERMHEVYACGLTPDTTYYFRVGGGPAGKEQWSEVHSFRTTPAPGAGQVTIGVTGDSRGENGDAWHLLARRLKSAAPNLSIFSGDIVNLSEDQIAWEKWLDHAWKDTDGSLLTLGQNLTLSTHGNHEAHTTLFYGNLVLPQEPSTYPQYTELFFSVDVGPVHLVVYDDYWVGNPSGDPGYADVLTKWLDADLGAAEANRAKVPWIVTVHHHGPFSSAAHSTDADVLRGRRYMVPIYDKHHVDLDLAGHDHNYERSKVLSGPLDANDAPVVKSSNVDGTVYVICAGAGAPSYAPGTSSFTQMSHGYDSNGAVGLYGLLTADKTTLKLEAKELRADASDPVFDTMTISKP